MNRAEEQRRIAELTNRSAEERAADAEATSKLVERAKLGVVPRLAPAPRRDDATPLADLLARIQSKAENATQERMALPCYRAMYPMGVEPEDVSERVDDSVGAAACDSVGAWKTCDRAASGFGCPRFHTLSVYERARENLSKARVPKDDCAVILAGALGKPPLRGYDTMRVVRAFRARKSQEVKLKEGAEYLVGDRSRVGAVHFNGDERVLLLGGNKGRGKTTAAAYLLACEGGMYTTEYEFTRPGDAGGIDIVEAKRAKVLVIDQFGRGAIGKSPFALGQIEEVIDSRKANLLLTVLVGNVRIDEEFKARYDVLILSRIYGYGAIVLFDGPDLREAMRGAA